MRSSSSASRLAFVIGGGGVAAGLVFLLLEVNPSPTRPSPIIPSSVPAPSMDATVPTSPPTQRDAGSADPGSPTPWQPVDPEPVAATSADPAPFTGAEGLRSEEIDRIAAEQGVSSSVFLEARKTGMIVGESRNFERVTRLLGHDLPDQTRDQLERASTAYLQTISDVVQAYQRAELDEAGTLDRLREIQGEYQAMYEEATGLTAEQYADLGTPPR